MLKHPERNDGRFFNHAPFGSDYARRKLHAVNRVEGDGVGVTKIAERKLYDP